MNPICTYLGYLFVSYCLVQNGENNETVTSAKSENSFNVEYQWHYINFTWPSSSQYQINLLSEQYIPENIVITGMKYYKNDIFLALPQIRKGVPVTLGKISTKKGPKLNPLIEPFPNWSYQIDEKDCSTLQSVQNLEIDKNGIMWVLDGFRINNNTDCPPKLVLFDINNKGKEILSYIFPKDICSFDGGYLKDVVIESGTDGYAFITDNSVIDPGLIVYSRKQNRAWKVRDKTMFDEHDASGFMVGNLTFNRLSPLSGIALAPSKIQKKKKLLFYSSISGMNLYAIKTRVLKNEKIINSGEWRRSIQVIGEKQSQSDGLTMDNKGNLFYTLPPLYGVGKWNLNSEFSTSEIITEHKDMMWTSSFSFDDKGYLRVLTNNVHKFLDLSYPLKMSKKVMIQIYKYYTGTKSYLY